jgi:RNase P/RNase MRP subunit p29
MEAAWLFLTGYRDHAAARGALVIPDGTELKLRLKQAVSSATAEENQPVVFEVAENVTIDGVTIFAKGAESEGKVVRATHRKGFGRRGKVDFTIDTVEAVDGQKIYLRTARSARGDESTTPPAS